VINFHRVIPTATIATATFLLTLTATPAAIAQEVQAGLEEIVVTARKREESLLEVPLAITALTADDIENKGITEFKDIIDFTPGFFFAEHSVGRADRSNRILVVRGMHISNENDHQQAATVFVDGAPMLGSVVAGLEDAERIEVIRGPQSAYFGRSTFAGAVNYVTKTPGNEFAGKFTADAAKFGTYNLGMQVEGPIAGDTLAGRISASQYSTDGQWTLSNDPNTTLGAQETTSIAGSLYFTPSDNFSAKFRYHTWEDKDGPGAAIGYGIGNGEGNFNCNLPDSTLAPRNGANNWICGEAPMPTAAEIQGDFILTPDKESLLNGVSIPDAVNLDSIFLPPFLNGFGFERRADQASLILDYEFDNGVALSSITAWHKNEWMALDDLDRRYTEPLGAAMDTALLNSRYVEDFSQEVRLSSDADQRLRWLLGVSYSDMEGTRTSGFRVLGLVLSFSLGNTFDIQNVGVFGSIEYDITDRLTVSVEGRQQEDKVEEARTSGAETVSGTFSSFNPRVILDWKVTDNVSLYASYAEGTRPGQFNVNLIGQDQSVLDQLAAIGLGLEVPEEELDNMEIGLKGSFLDGRAWLQAAIYQGDWLAQSVAGTTVTLPGGGTDFIAGTVVGGEIELSGIELEGAWAATDNLTLEGTYSLNKSKIKANASCGDCAVLLGDGDITGLGKKLQRNPETQGSLSGTYAAQLNSEYDWYSRLDYIHTGSKYATDANITETGDSNRINLRFGIEKENMRIELYGENLTEDQTFTNYQFLIDFANINPAANRVLTAGLPDKRTWGVRFNYDF
jgi:iron complex outermembrane receptor protein